MRSVGMCIGWVVFMEVKPLSNELLDSVVRDVIDSGSVSFSVEDSPGALDKEEFCKPENLTVESVNSEMSVSVEANEFVESLIEKVVSNVETEKMEQKVSESCTEVNSTKICYLPGCSIECPSMVKHEENNENDHTASSDSSCKSNFRIASNTKATSFFVPLDRNLKSPAQKTRTKKSLLNNLFDQKEFEDLVDAFSSQLVNEALTFFNPLFRFYRANGTPIEIDIQPNSVSLITSLHANEILNENSSTDVYTAQSSRPVIEVSYVQDPQPLLERKFFDMKRWVCISRPQYKYSCGISSVVSCFNFLFSTLGNGDLAPVTQEHAMRILGFEPPFNQIRFGPFTGNATLKKWFNRLTTHFDVSGYFYTLYKPQGAKRTSISAEVALVQFKEGLVSTDTALIYHCFNHYMCPVGFEVTPAFPELAYGDVECCYVNSQYAPRSWFIFSDTSQTSSSMHSIKWEDIVTDLNCVSPFHFNARKPHLGVFKGSQKNAEKLSLDKESEEEASEYASKRKIPSVLGEKGKNLHCIMAMKRLKGKNPSKDKEITQEHESSTFFEPCNESLVVTSFHSSFE